MITSTPYQKEDLPHQIIYKPSAGNVTDRNRIKFTNSWKSTHIKEKNITNEKTNYITINQHNQSTEESKEEVSVESNKREDTHEEESTEETADGKREFDEQIVDSEIATIKLTSIETKKDEFMPNDKHIITFEVENKSDQKIGLQMRDLSIGNEMVSAEYWHMHGEATPGKTAKVKLEIKSYEEGTPTPELADTIEGALLILDAETFEDIEHHDFSIGLGE